jgi:parvulin-like peptidyl-prolyl isomerase
MSWRGLWALAWMAAGLPVCGCAAAEPSRVGDWVAPALSGRPQDAAGAVTAGSENVARSQKPEPGPVVAVGLNQAPERPRDALLARPAARILAVVNNEAILDEEVRASCLQELAGARTADEQAAVISHALTNIIEREIILQEIRARFARMGPQGAKTLERIREDAAKEFQRSFVRRMVKGNHLASEEDLGRFLREHGMSLEMVRRQWERQFMAQMYLRSRIAPFLDRIGHADIAEYFEKHPEEFQIADSVTWQDLFVDAGVNGSREAARAFAEELAAHVRHAADPGADFAELGKKYDGGDSALRKNEGIGHRPGEVRPPEAEPVLFRMKDGEVGMVEIGSGFHVVRLVHRDYAGPMPFDDKVQKQIKDKLRGEVAQREMKRLIAEMKHKAVIEIASQRE